MALTLHVLKAKHGDCMVFNWGEGAAQRRILIDGGPAGVFRDALLPFLKKLANGGSARFERAMITHIDDDHIHGLLDLLKAMDAPPPVLEMPNVTIRGLWFNSFAAGLRKIHPGALGPAGVTPAEVIQEAHIANDPGLNEKAQLVAASVTQGVNVRAAADKLGIKLNPEYQEDLIIGSSSSTQRFAALKPLTITVLGPSQTRIDDLKDKWEKDAPNIKTKPADYANRTVENLSSIILLVEAQGAGGKRRFLFPGDSGGDLIIEALQETGLLAAGGQFHVDLLKVQHHGSRHSIVQRFFETVTADRYVFSGNGKHDNPHPEVLGWLAKARANSPYTAYLTYEDPEFDEPANKPKWDAFFQAEKANPKHKYVFAGAQPDDVLTVPLD